MKYLRTVIVDDESISASDVKTYDLQINPVSFLVLTVKGLNVTDEATLAEILARLTKITVSQAGETRFDMSGADLYALNCWLLRNVPIRLNSVATDNATRAVTLIIPFGRKLYDPKECHPATRRGEFKIQITFSATETAIDGIILQLEAVELLGATPTRYLKSTTLSDTPAATGDVDLDLPIGNKVAGLLVYSTTVPTTTAWTTTVDKLRVLLNNVEHMIGSCLWEGLHGSLLDRIGFRGDFGAAAGDDTIAHYAVCNFTPGDVDDFLIDTAGASSFKTRITAGDTNAYRVLPIELVGV